MPCGAPGLPTSYLVMDPNAQAGTSNPAQGAVRCERRSSGPVGTGQQPPRTRLTSRKPAGSGGIRLSASGLVPRTPASGLLPGWSGPCCADDVSSTVVRHTKVQAESEADGARPGVGRAVRGRARSGVRPRKSARSGHVLTRGLTVPHLRPSRGFPHERQQPCCWLPPSRHRPVPCTDSPRPECCRPPRRTARSAGSCWWQGCRSPSAGTS